MRKTSITLGALKVLKAKGLVSKVLVLATVRACYTVWPDEIRKWTDFHGLSVEILHGPKKDAALARAADIYVINYEGLEWLTGATKSKGRSGKTKVTVDLRRWKALGFDTLVCDELHKLKNTSSNRFKMVKQVHHTFARRWGLTGSPAANGLEDLFGQMYVLDQGRSLGPYVTHFRSEYFHTVDRNLAIYELQAGAEERIYDRLAPLAMRLTAEDYIHMPKMVPNDIKLDMPPEARRVYDEMEDDLLTQIGGGVVTAANAAVAMGKCRQIANGGLYRQDAALPSGLRLPRSKRTWVNLHTAKVDALADLIEELQGQPLLVAYDFEHDLDRLQERLGAEVPYIGGGVSMKRGAELARLWNAGKLPVLLGNPQAMAESLNLQEAGSHVCWHSLTWDFTLYDQFIRRVRRSGNRHQTVTVHHLLMRDTVDTYALLPATKSKDRCQQALFRGLTDRARQRRARS